MKNNLLLATYTIGNDLISRYNHATSQTSYYHYDGLGSTRQLTDFSNNVVAEYVYDAWGDVLASTDATGNVYGFTGKQQFGEAAGLIFLRARYYNPGTGKFISKDPSGFRYRGVGNLYVYCSNNPVNRLDLTGEKDKGQTKEECNRLQNEWYDKHIRGCRRSHPWLLGKCVEECMGYDTMGDRSTEAGWYQDGDTSSTRIISLRNIFNGQTQKKVRVTHPRKEIS